MHDTAARSLLSNRLNLVESEVRRRSFLQGSAMAAMGFGAQWIRQPREASAAEPSSSGRSVIYIFLSGGLGQHDSFDMKPEAAADIRGEFAPIATATPGIQICEHLPMLAARSQHWSLVRSLTHPYNEHSQGHMVMLSGQSNLPIGFNPGVPKPTDHPSIAAIVGSLIPDKNSLPPTFVLPEKLIHRTGRVIPGQFAGVMGAHRDPYFLAASRYNAQSYGAWPEYGFHHQSGAVEDPSLEFRTPNLSRPDDIAEERFERRLKLLHHMQTARVELSQLEETQSLQRYQERAISLLADPRMKQLFNVTSAPQEEQLRYGRNTFGWSLLLAKRLVQKGVRFVQVNLGNNETWDTHGNAFPHLKDFLLPPFDRSLSALLDDLYETGQLEDTLVVVAGEFGRTPKVFGLPAHYKLPGRDHWGKVQTVLLAGGGIRGGRVVGATDRQGGEPADAPQKPENLAATMYRSLGFSGHTTWRDLSDRPIPIYNGQPISDLT